MNNIWLATDWHLWNTEYDDGRHKFKSITRLGQLADNYTQMIDSSDIFIHLGDLCDPSNTKPEKLKSIITSIPGAKVLCRGNHDIETDVYYLNAGFDYVCEILKINDFVFSHKPVKITPDQINVHGHLHTRKISTMDHRYVNAYDVNYTDRPVLLEDLLDHGVKQPESEWESTKLNHVEEKMQEYTSIEHDKYSNILDLSNEFSLTEAIDWKAGNDRATAAALYGDRNAQNMIKHSAVVTYCTYTLIINSSNITDTANEKLKNKAFKYIEKMGNSKLGKKSNAYILDETFKYLSEFADTLNKALAQYNKGEKVTAKSSVLSAKAVEAYCKTMEKNGVKDTKDLNKRIKECKEYYAKVKNNKLDESSAIPALHSLSATEIEKNDDPLDEIIFEENNDINESSKYVQKRKMGKNEFLVYDVDHIKSGELKLEKSIISMSTDIIDGIMRTSPEMLNSEELRAIKNAEDLVSYLGGLYNRYGGNAKSHWNFGLYNLMGLAAQKGIYEESEIVKEMEDAFPLDNLRGSINRIINELEHIENVVSAMILQNSELFGIAVGRNNIEKVQNILAKDSDIDVLNSNGSHTYRYDRYSKYGLSGRVFISKQVYNDYTSGKTQVVITPDRFYSRMLRYDFIIFSHGTMSPDKYFTIQPIEIDNREFTTVEAAVNYLSTTYNNPKILVMGCNEKHIKLPKKYDTFVDYADDRIVMENAVNIKSDDITAVSDLKAIITAKIKRVLKVKKKLGRILDEYELRNSNRWLVTVPLIGYATDDVISLGFNQREQLQPLTVNNYPAIHVKLAFDSVFTFYLNCAYYTELLLTAILNRMNILKERDSYYWGMSEFSAKARPLFGVRFNTMAEAIENFKIYQSIHINEEPLQAWLYSDKLGESVKLSDKDDPMNEVIFEDPEDTIKWEQDDDNPNLYKEKEPMAEAVFSGIKEVTLTADHLAELHKANPNLANILPDDGKELNDPDKYYCTKCWVNNEGSVVATASVRYPIANGNTYSDIQSITIAPGYEHLNESVNEYVVTKLCNNRLFSESIVIPTESINIYDRKYEILEEAAKASKNEEIYPVYIFLVNSGSVMAKMINGVTGDDYTHAAISFTPDLKTMYSFGQKQENGTGFGFAVESINNKWYKGTDMLYSIYCVFVTGPQLKKMRDRVQYFVKHGTHFMFDFPGLFLNAMNISANPQHRYFCSRFVADVLNSGSPTKKNQYIKDASYMRPQDFTETNFAYFICSGKIKSFRHATVKKQTEKAKEEEINARMMRGKTSQHFTVQRFQEAASELHPMTREEMDNLNRKWDLRPIGKDYEKEKALAEYDEKRKLKKEYKEKQREYKRQERERAKADRKKAKEDRAKAKAGTKKKSSKNEEVEVEHNYLLGDQIRWFDHQDYHNTVIGESIIKLEDQNMRFLDGLNEAALKKDKIVPVYVILTYTGSLVSRGVKFFTGDEYTHVSISFDSSLRNMYTFGRLNDENIFRGTFKKEDISSPYYQNHDPKVPYAVYIVPCTESEVKLMKKRMKYFSENRDKFHFDFTGLFLNGLGIPNAPENRYFCSRFVSEVLNAGNPDSPLIADPTLQHPQDFADADFTYLVVSGPDITEYDRRVADRIVKDILRSKELVNVQKNRVKNESFNSLSLNSDDPYQTDLLHYKLAMINETHQLDDFIDYLRAFKINYDVSGNVIITRKEIDQLTEQYKFCTYRLNKHFYAANEVYWDDVKQELAVLTYLINLLNKYYLSPKVMQSNRVKKDLTDELLDLRSDMMKTYQDTLDKVLIHDPQFNANEYYKSSNLGNADKDAKTLETHLGKTVYIEL